VEYLADRMAVMQAGRLVETGRTDEVLRAPQEAYTRALLAAVPRLGEGAPIPPRARWSADRHAVQ
jgi:ABC-type glutathione transport system ATPase component